MSENHASWDRIGMTLKEIEKRLGNDRKLYTCFKCRSKKTCKFSYDVYNTDEDCIADK